MARRRRGRGEGAIFQRADGLWTASVSLGYDDSGKRKRRVLYGASKAEVQEKLRQVQTDAVSGHLPEAGALTVKQWLERWLENTARPHVQPKTHLRYEQLIRLRINPHIA